MNNTTVKSMNNNLQFVEKEEVIGFRAPSELKRGLEKLADKRGVKYSVVLRDILESELKAEGVLSDNMLK